MHNAIRLISLSRLSKDLCVFQCCRIVQCAVSYVMCVCICAIKLYCILASACTICTHFVVCTWFKPYTANCSNAQAFSEKNDVASLTLEKKKTKTHLANTSLHRPPFPKKIGLLTPYIYLRGNYTHNASI